MQSDNTDIFLSYHKRDNEFVQKFKKSLEDSGVSVWLDSSHIRVADKLKDKIYRAIDHASYVIPVISTKSLNSDWLEREVNYAKELNKTMIPLRLDGIEHGVLQRLNMFGDVFEDIVSVEVEDRNNFSDTVYKIIVKILEDTKFKIEELMLDIQPIRKKQNDRNKEIDEYRKKLDDIINEKKECQLLLEEMKEKFSISEDQNKEKEREIRNKAEYLNSVENKLTDAKNKISSLEDSIQTYIWKSEEQDNTIKDLAKERVNFTNEKKLIQKDIIYLRETIQELGQHNNVVVQDVLLPEEIIVEGSKDGKLKPFKMDSIPITNSMFLEFLKSKDGKEWRKSEQQRNSPNYLWYWYDEYSFISKLANAPLFAITPQAAKAYAQFKGKRLPTHNEWFHAFKVGNTDVISKYSICALQHNLPPAISILPCYKNELGIYHMSGLIWEYCYNDKEIKAYGGAWGTQGNEIFERIFSGVGGGIKQEKGTGEGIGLRLVSDI
jgi:hypothetical protein